MAENLHRHSTTSYIKLIKVNSTCKDKKNWNYQNIETPGTGLAFISANQIPLLTKPYNLTNKINFLNLYHFSSYTTIPFFLCKHKPLLTPIEYFVL